MSFSSLSFLASKERERERGREREECEESERERETPTQRGTEGQRVHVERELF